MDIYPSARCRAAARLLLGIVLCVAPLLLPACSTSQEMPLEKLDAADQRMVEGYSLLYELMSKQRELDGIFMIKSASDATKQLARDISGTSNTAARRLEQWAKANPAHGIRQPNLPAVEVDARAKIEEQTTVSLLTAGDDFELRLLLTQVDATNYGAALASVLAASDSNVQRAQFCTELAEQYTALNQRVRQRLALRPTTKAE
jgi:hypothetical protein